MRQAPNARAEGIGHRKRRRRLGRRPAGSLRADELVSERTRLQALRWPDALLLLSGVATLVLAAISAARANARFHCTRDYWASMRWSRSSTESPASGWARALGRPRGRPRRGDDRRRRVGGAQRCSAEPRRRRSLDRSVTPERSATTRGPGRSIRGRRRSSGSPRAAARARWRGSSSSSASRSRSGGTGTGRWRMIGPESTPSSTKCTVTPVIRTPCSSAWPIASRPGNEGSSAGWTLITRPGEAATNAGREQLHVAGEDDELDLAPLEPVGDRRSRASRPACSPAGNDLGRDLGVAGPLERPRVRPVGADRDHLDPVVGPWTWSRIACRLVPVPEASTPTRKVTRALPPAASGSARRSSAAARRRSARRPRASTSSARQSANSP